MRLIITIMILCIAIPICSKVAIENSHSFNIAGSYIFYSNISTLSFQKNSFFIEAGYLFQSYSTTYNSLRLRSLNGLLASIGYISKGSFIKNFVKLSASLLYDNHLFYNSISLAVGLYFSILKYLQIGIASSYGLIFNKPHYSLSLSFRLSYE